MVGVVDLVVMACVLRATTKKGLQFFSLALPQYFLLEPPLKKTEVGAFIVKTQCSFFLRKCSATMLQSTLNESL